MAGNTAIINPKFFHVYPEVQVATDIGSRYNNEPAKGGGQD